MTRTLLSLLLALLTTSAAADYRYSRILTGLPGPAVEAPPPDPLAINLNAAFLPEGWVGQPYSYDFKAHASITGDGAPAEPVYSWSAVDALPPGLSLSADGVLSGTPTTEGATSFTVTAAYDTAEGQQTYQVAVAVPISVALATTTLPEATVGEAYSYDFKPLASISGTNAPASPSYNWSFAGTLPTGLSLNASGVISGTPASAGSNNFSVTATYEGAQGQRSYTIVVNGVTLQVTQISNGLGHTCAVTTAGAVMCWGQNTYGQLGNNSTVNSLNPVPVFGLGSGVASVTTGDVHSCALTTAGAVYCWGRSNLGQTGTGTTGTRLIPTAITSLSSGVLSVRAGGSHTCAVLSNHNVNCWGYNYSGQIGDGSITNKLSPVEAFVYSVAAVAPGSNHTCALLTNGSVRCWGHNGSGQLGDGSTTERTSPATYVSNLSNAVDLVSGSGFSCAQTTSGAAMCWGSNSNGQLGDGSGTQRLTPVMVTGLDNGVTLLSTGAAHACAIHNGMTKCWGYNAFGQLGDGTTRTRTAPVNVSGLASGVSVLSRSSSSSHTCALTTAGAALCWGNNGSGQLGDGTTADRTTPVDVGMP